MNPLLRLAYSAAGQVASLAALVAPAIGGKVVQSVRGRRRVVARWEHWGREHRDDRQPLIWFHAPSVGEGLQARPVMELIRARHPDWQIAYSYFSPSAAAFARGLPADVVDFLPFDTVRAARRLLAALRPTVLVFAKLDAWPLLCETVAAAGVPLGMISATVAPGSARLGMSARALLRDAHARFAAVGAISEGDAERLTEAGFPRETIQVTGDTRYDQVAARARGVDREAPLLSRLASRRATLVAGSTWPSDNAVLLAAWPRVRAEVPDARLIIAPHEPTPAHLAPIESWARAASLSFARLDVCTPATDVVVVDRVGVLGDLYALGNAALVGGGFHAAGLHSVLEPAAYGIPVAFGPRHTNSRDAGLLIEAGGAVMVPDVTRASRCLATWLGDRSAGTRAGQAALGVVRNGLGAAERAYALVRRLAD